MTKVVKDSVLFRLGALRWSPGSLTDIREVQVGGQEDAFSEVEVPALPNQETPQSITARRSPTNDKPSFEDPRVAAFYDANVASDIDYEAFDLLLVDVFSFETQKLDEVRVMLKGHAHLSEDYGRDIAEAMQRYIDGNPPRVDRNADVILRFEEMKEQGVREETWRIMHLALRYGEIISAPKPYAVEGSFSVRQTREGETVERALLLVPVKGLAAAIAHDVGVDRARSEATLPSIIEPYSIFVLTDPERKRVWGYESMYEVDADGSLVLQIEAIRYAASLCLSGESMLEAVRSHCADIERGARLAGTPIEAFLMSIRGGSYGADIKQHVRGFVGAEATDIYDRLKPRVREDFFIPRRAPELERRYARLMGRLIALYEERMKELEGHAENIDGLVADSYLTFESYQPLALKHRRWLGDDERFLSWDDVDDNAVPPYLGFENIYGITEYESVVERYYEEIRGIHGHVEWVLAEMKRLLKQPLAEELALEAEIRELWNELRGVAEMQIAVDTMLPETHPNSSQIFYQNSMLVLVKKHDRRD